MIDPMNVTQMLEQHSGYELSLPNRFSGAKIHLQRKM